MSSFTILSIGKTILQSSCFALSIYEFINLSKHTIRQAYYTVQKMKFSNKDFSSKCDQIRSFLRIWSHLLKKSLMETSFFVQCRKPGILAPISNFHTLKKTCNYFHKKSSFKRFYRLLNTHLAVAQICSLKKS